MKPYVSQIFIYPIKSLDRISCDRVKILKSGALEGDRTWGIFDQDDRIVNAKRNQKIHALRSEINLDTNTLSLRVQRTSKSAKFNLIEQQVAVCNWLSSYFEFPVKLKQNYDLGFPDDTVSPGATIVSTATLEEVASWYSELDTNDVRLRFRANIEIAGVPPFWEDRLFTIAGQTVKFKLGKVEFMGVNPCQRCVVITRDPQTGKAYPGFKKTFINQRKATLPKWSERSRFNHFFRLAVNTKLSSTEAGKIIRVGDKVVVT